MTRGLLLGLLGAALLGSLVECLLDEGTGYLIGMLAGGIVALWASEPKR